MPKHHFVEIHRLMVRPPSNPNRDDVGRPKTALLGGVERLRHSSQSEKRAIRTSDVFQEALSGHIGLRTRSFGAIIVERLVGVHGMEEAKAEKLVAAALKSMFKPGKKAADDGDDGTSEESNESKESKGSKNQLECGQLVFLSPAEIDALEAVADKLAGDLKTIPELKSVLRLTDAAAMAVDVAMFGRMVSYDTSYNIGAAVQVSHSISTHKAVIEDDFYTAVDDYTARKGGTVTGHLGNAGFAAGVMYQYVQVNVDLLVKNLGGDETLAARAIHALVETLGSSSPGGKRASYANGTRAGWMRVDVVDTPVSNLAGAFLDPIRETMAGGSLEASIRAFEKAHADNCRAYGLELAASAVMDVAGGQGTLAELATIAAASV